MPSLHDEIAAQQVKQAVKRALTDPRLTHAQVAEVAAEAVTEVLARLRREAEAERHLETEA